MCLFGDNRSGLGDSLELGVVLGDVDASWIVLGFQLLPGGVLVLDQEVDHFLGALPLRVTALLTVVGERVGQALCGQTTRLQVSENREIRTKHTGLHCKQDVIWN